MSYIFDAALVALAVICIVFSMKRGFISASRRLLALILTAVLLTSSQPFILNFLQSTPASGAIRKMVEKNITQSYKREGLSEDINTTETEETQGVVSSLGFPKFMQKSIQRVVSGMTEIKNNVMEVVTDAVTLMILKLLSVVLLFLLVKLLVFLLLKLLEGLFELPGLKTLNRVLGALLGVINALLLIYIICGAVSFFAPSEKLIIIEETVKNTFIVKHFYENNLLMSLFI
ncbi:MAG: CvpA family protein [Clostridia bacterium]|nr:CvpA family protein [Clostridia bacterium]